MKLSDQTAAVLAILAGTTDPAGDQLKDNTGTAMPSRTTFAWAVADQLRKRGFDLKTTGKNAESTGAANSLRALRRHGLAGRNTPGIFDQADWWITPEGLAEHEERETDGQAE